MAFEQAFAIVGIFCRQSWLPSTKNLTGQTPKIEFEPASGGDRQKYASQNN